MNLPSSPQEKEKGETVSVGSSALVLTRSSYSNIKFVNNR